MSEALRVQIESEADLFILEYRVKNFAGQNNLDGSPLLLICRELATNILKYGGRGFVEVKLHPREILVEAHDAGKRGEGSQPLSLSRGLGIGLKVVKSNAREVRVEQSPLGGMAFIVRLSLDEHKKGLSLEMGVATRPRHLEEENGDICLVKKVSGRYMVVVADALGHGKRAREVARLIEEYSLAFGGVDLKKYYWELNRKLSGSRGSALFVALIGDYELEYLNVGNIRAWIVSGGDSERLLEHPGVVGRIPVNVEVHRKNINFHNTMLVVCTDGISSKFFPRVMSFFEKIDVQKMADGILAEYGILEDDATVVIVKG
ncbi:MAG: SpoIIE family protein phosphatase [Candidatus Atribacteria bacterium]|nr:SpoIIE family protein phosphatase [Candidatus Atribacteria bacterium]